MTQCADCGNEAKDTDDLLQCRHCGNPYCRDCSTYQWVHGHNSPGYVNRGHLHCPEPLRPDLGRPDKRPRR